MGAIGDSCILASVIRGTASLKALLHGLMRQIQTGNRVVIEGHCSLECMHVFLHRPIILSDSCPFLTLAK